MTQGPNIGAGEYRSRESAHRDVEDGVQEIWRNLSQGRHHKRAFGEARMRKRQLGRLDHQLIVEEQVDIDEAWAKADSLNAPERLLHRFDAMEYVEWSQRRMASANGVVETRLIGNEQRRGIVYR